MTPASDYNAPLSAAGAEPTVLDMVGARTGCARGLPEPAGMSHQQQQQGSSSAEQSGPVRGTAELEPGTRHAGSAGGRCFTPDQQAVVAALMVVMGRAMGKGGEAALATIRTLSINNSATRALLRMLPALPPLPTMKRIQQDCFSQQASVQILNSLNELAAQCAEARCRPLEVFTRSAECSARRAVAEESIANQQEDPQGQQRAQQQEAVEYSELKHSDRQGTERDLQELGAQHGVAALIASFLNVFRHLVKKHGRLNTNIICADLGHLLPGTPQRTLQYMRAVMVLRPATNGDLDCGLCDVCLLSAKLLHKLLAFPHLAWHCCADA